MEDVSPEILDALERFNIHWSSAVDFPTDLYFSQGKLWRPGWKGNSGLNFSHAISDVQAYALPYNDPEERAQFFDLKEFVPYETADHFVWTLRKAAEEGTFFDWPSKSLACSKAIATAIHTLPPGAAVIIKNEMALPMWARGDRRPQPTSSVGGGRQTDADT